MKRCTCGHDRKLHDWLGDVDGYLCWGHTEDGHACLCKWLNEVAA